MFRMRVLLVGLILVVAVVSGTPPLQLEDQIGLPIPVYVYENFQIVNNVSTTEKNRLPTSLKPSHYKLDITPILDDSLGPEKKFTAPGTVEITIISVVATSVITLNSKYITFNDKDVTVTGNPKVEVKNVEFIETKETVKIHLTTPLVKGTTYVIKINFVALVHDEIGGIFKSFYTSDDGTQKYLAATQFESVGARRAFPCFDEPALRATFDIRVGKKSSAGYHALSNMPFKRDVDISSMPGYSFSEFDRTISMPTYLIAIVVSDFNSYTVPESNPIVKTWGPPNQMDEKDEQGVFSANVAAKILKYFAKYFDSPYQISKLDSVAVSAFSGGAMENWGLNTYSSPLLLFVKGDSTQFERWRQAAVISHEVAHNWFGNLVTINWWNDLWLKEGFARYLQFQGVQNSGSNMDAMERFILDTFQIAMVHDIGPNTHPLRGDWIDSKEYQNSRIIYEKGASIIRMMQTFLTDNTFQRGLRKYLKNFEYGSTVQDDLFNTLTVEAIKDGRLQEGQTVNKIMNTWTLQSGFPLVRISAVSPVRVYISQEKFLALGQSFESSTTGGWEIPVTYITNSKRELNDWTPKKWIGSNVALTSIALDSTKEWVLFNPDARSYYRVLYDNNLFQLLITQLDEDFTPITSSSRSQLIDDYFAFAANSYTTYQDPLELSKYLVNEPSLTVWTTALNHFNNVFNYFTNNPTMISSLDKFIGKRIEVQLGKLLNDPTEDTFQTILKSKLFDWACRVGHQLCHDTAIPLMQKWSSDPDPTNNPVEPDMQPIVYCVGYRTNTALKNFVIKQYTNMNLSVKQRGLLLNARACDENLISLKEMLQKMLDPEDLMPRVDKRALLAKIAANPVAGEEVMSFLDANVNLIISKLGDDIISSVISSMSVTFSSEEHFNQVKEFLDTHSPTLPKAVRTSIENSLATIKSNQEWNIKNTPDFEEWFEKFERL